MTRVTGTWLKAEGAQSVLSMLEQAGHQAFTVGGCVRNALLDAPVSDVDIATDARPETVMDLAKSAGLKPVPTGIDHGTITVVADGSGYEVTTFRADVETDGRRAVVAFSDRIETDAARRDFTMNALYARADGEVVDPLGGLPDLNARHLRFINDPTRRIQEDYLRILRYFRFFAWYCDPEKGFDAEALAAIAANLDGLAQLSRERVGAEMTKLLSAPDPAPSLGAMAQSGALGVILPGAVVDTMAPLIHFETALGLAPDPMRRLANLGEIAPDTLRLSKSQLRHWQTLRDLCSDSQSLTEMAYRQNANTAQGVLALRQAGLGMPLPSGLPDLDAAERAIFPIRAADLQSHFTGPALGQVLRALECQWIASDFRMSRVELLNSLPKG